MGRPGKQASLKTYSDTPKKSAVLVLLFPEDEVWKTVLMLRNAYQGVHSQQVSFPGGRVEPEDQTLKDTALRETEEEIGVNRNEIKVIGNLTELFIPPSGYLVSPFVGYVEERPHFVPDQIEVNELIYPHVESLLDSSIRTQALFESGITHTKIKAPCFVLEGHKVWGATAMMLSEFIAVLNQLPKPKNT